MATLQDRFLGLSGMRRFLFLYTLVIAVMVACGWASSWLAQLVTVLVVSALIARLINLTLVTTFRRRRRQRLSPTNRAVLITGCDSGFGNKLARALDATGFKVFAACLGGVEEEGGKKLSEECKNINVIKMDITKQEDVERAYDFVVNNLGGMELWAVVNNAGIGLFTEIEWCPMYMYERVMSVNTLGLVRVTKQFLPLLRESQGRVVNVASLAGRFAWPGFSAYTMSKFAIIAFSNALRREMTKWNVTVSTIEPTLYKTSISSESILRKQTRKLWEETPAEVRAVYGEQYFQEYEKLMVRHLSKAREDLDEVVDSMMDAVTSTHPESRYVPGVMATRVRASLLQAMPETWQDSLLIPAGQPPARTLSTRSYSLHAQPTASYVLRRS